MLRTYLYNQFANYISCTNGKLSFDAPKNHQIARNQKQSSSIIFKGSDVRHQIESAIIKLQLTGNQAIKNKDSKAQLKIPGISKTDILLFYINMQLNYTMYEHQFYPNIVLYYQYANKKIEENPECETKKNKQQSELKKTSILEKTTNTNLYPYNCLGLITGISENNKGKEEIIGTGCLVAPNLVLTSASLVVQAETCLPLKQLKFLPKFIGTIGSTSMQISEITDLKITSKFLIRLKQKSYDCGEDYALLLLSRPIQRDKYINIGYDIDNYCNAQLFGYSIGQIKVKFQQKYYKQMDMKGKILKLSHQTFQHDIKAKSTCGGAPIIVEYVEDFLFVVGIHNNTSNNTACRMTQYKVKTLQKWGKQLTKEQFTIKTVKMANAGIHRAQVPKGFVSLIDQIALMQQRVDQQRQFGDSDQLRFCLGKLGELCWKNGQFNRSIIYLEEGLKVCNNLHKPQSIQSAFFYSNLGLNYDKLKQYERAFKNFETALRINRRNKGENNHGVATAYNNIGNIFKRKGRYEKALEYYSKSLKIKIKLFGGRSQGVAASLSNIALIQWQKKNYSQAIKKYKQTLEIYKQIFGPSHFQISRTLYNLALCYYDIRQYDSWLDKHCESLSILQELKMRQHPSYNKRRSIFLSNLCQIANSNHCKNQFILKALKVLSLLFIKGEDGGMIQLLHKRVEM